MTDAVEVAVEAALLARAQAFADANSLTISLPGISFTPPTVAPSAKWLRASFMPADTLSLGINPESTNQHYGLFQVDVFFCESRGGPGEIAAARIAADVIDYFKRGTQLSRDGFTVHVLRAPWRMPMMGKPDDPWLMIPVRIAYTSYAGNPA